MWCGYALGMEEAVMKVEVKRYNRAQFPVRGVALDPDMKNHRC